MRIYFSPEYTGSTYVDFGENGVRMDTQIMGVAGLMDFLQQHIGMHVETASPMVRLAAYYKAMKKYMAENPENILSKSFKLSGISTARECLGWRDTLAMAGWDGTVSIDSSRMKVLSGIEEYFDCKGKAEVYREIIDNLMSAPDFKDVEIHISPDIDLLPPFLQQVIKIMQDKGVFLDNQKEGGSFVHGPEQPWDFPQNNIHAISNLLYDSEEETKQITLNEEDHSFQIWHFDDETEAEQLLADFNDDEGTLWISASNKATDNWLKMMNKPVAGSSTADSTPQIIQLFILGIGLFLKPFNINNLVSWLYSPDHPINGKLRFRLAETICRSGGYYNDSCEKLIESYLAENPDKEDTIKTFLPQREDDNTTEGKINLVRLTSFITSLKSWARQRAKMIAEENSTDIRIEQLYHLGEMCETMLILLEDEEGQEISYTTIDSMMTNLYKASSFSQYHPQAGCRFTIDTPAKIADYVNTTIWCGFYNDAPHKLSLSFLTPGEKRQLQSAADITMWDEQKETEYYKELQELPFHKTLHELVLVVCDRQQGAPVQKHPLLVRLETQVTNLDKFILYPHLDPNRAHEVSRVDNRLAQMQYRFKNTDAIKWPEKISATSIETLIEHPLDYFMDNILNIGSSGLSQLSEVRITKGNVAHAVIERLFSPSEGKQYTKPEDVEATLSARYTPVFNEVLEDKGAIFLLKENILFAKNLKVELLRCIKRLIAIMKTNNLRVTACEMKLRQNIGLDDNNEQDPLMTGMMDMVLEDVNHKPVVFDFKWTTSKSYYNGLLEKNRSVQLAIYAAMLSREKKDIVEKTAYFLMPQGRLYSTSLFLGDNCEQIIPAEVINSSSPWERLGEALLQQIKNSYRYRKNEIMSGIIDLPENVQPDGVKYVQNAEADNLFPLDVYNDLVSTNMFSNFAWLDPND